MSYYKKGAFGAIIVCMIVSSGCFNWRSSSQIIPLSVLFGNPERVGVRISPDGHSIAYLAPLNGVMNIWVKKLNEAHARPITSETSRGLRTFMWLYDNKHVVYPQDQKGDENWHYFKVNVETTQETPLTPFEGVQARLLHYSKKFPDKALITMNKDDKRFHDVYELNLITGDLALIEKNPGSIVNWYADDYLRVRVAIRETNDGGTQVLVRNGSDQSWPVFLEWDFDASSPSAVLGLNADGTILYVVNAQETDTARFEKIDIATGVRTIIASDSVFDGNNLIVHPDTKEVIAAVINKERQEIRVLAEKYQKDFTYLRTLDQGEIRLLSYDSDFNNWIVAFEKDAGPVSYYLYDRTATQARYLFDNRDDLKNYTLASMEPITLRARDGLLLHGYYTVPVGVKPVSLPMVLLVHGGPWSRDSWGYHADVQWLANRGYAVLQINFRGSTGYGKSFVKAGNLQWSRAMHDDLIDAVQWAIDKGIADPKRIAIYGGSYGGYAALVGATFTPDVFACAIDMVGPSNLITLLNSLPEYWHSYKEKFKRQVGNVDTQQEFLESCSPLFKADAIKIPMLIAQGAHDPRVKQAEAEQIVAAMKAKSIEHTYMLFEDEGHGLVRPENRLKFYAEAEKFLAGCLK